MNRRIFSFSSVASCTLLLTLAGLAHSAPVNSVLTLNLSPNPIVQGQTATFTAGVNQTTAASPTGTVTVTDTCPDGSSSVLGTILLGSSTSPSPGAGTLQISSFPCLGANQISGSYSGDANYLPSSSQPFIATVLSQFTPVTTTLTSSPNPATVAQSIVFSAQLTFNQVNNTNPTGTVTFTDTSTGTVLGTSPVQTVGGPRMQSVVATLTTSLAAGVYAVQAAYSGDNIYSPSTSQIVSQVVQGTNPFPTSTALTASASQITVGQSVALTAQVSSPDGVPSGAVSFYDSKTLLATLNLNSAGQAVLNTSSLGAGDHSITASYGGDASFAPSVSGAVTITVQPAPPPTLAPTTTTLNSSANPALDGDTITLSATITSSSPGTPTGTVTFSNGTAALGTSNVQNGVATLNVSFPAGTYHLSATYSGDSNFSSSVGTLSQIVNPRTLLPTTATISSSTNPSTVGNPVTFKAVVTAADSGVPTGSVTFTVGSTTAVVNLDSTGTAVFTTSSLPIGSASISASYLGDSNYAGSMSPTLIQAVLGVNSWGPAPSAAKSSIILSPLRAGVTSVPNQR